MEELTLSTVGARGAKTSESGDESGGEMKK